MSPVFAHGALRLYLLKLLEEHPRHGYDVIRLLEDRFSGLYTPSAGTIYPRLARLEADGLVERVDEDGRKTYSITAAGRAELDERRDELADLELRVTGSARDLAREIRVDVRASVRDLREELRGAVREARSERRRTGEPARGPRRGRADEIPESRGGADARTELRWLRRELDEFAREILDAAAGVDLGTETGQRVTTALRDARTAVHAALTGQRPTSGD